jgi:hypothetical protein
MAEAGVIKAGLAAVELVGDTGPLAAALGKARGMLMGYASGVAKIGATMAAAGGAITAPVLGLFKGAIDQAAGMGALASQMGTTAEEASRLTYAMGKFGLAQEDVTGFSRKMAHAIGDLRDNVPGAVTQFQRLGIVAEDLEGKGLTEQMILLGSQISKMPEVTDRMRYSVEFFGRSGVASLNAFKDGAKGLREGMAESDKVGATVTAQQAENARQINLEFKKMAAAIKYAFLEVGRALLGEGKGISDLAARVVEVGAGVRSFIRENKELIKIVLGVGAALTAAGTALLALGAAGAALTGIVGGVASIGTALAAIAPALPVILAVAAAVAAVAGGAYLLATRTDAGRQSMERAMPVFRSFGDEARASWATVKDAAVEAWGGIASALRRGDLEAAGEIAVAGLNVIWRQARIFFASTWRTARHEWLSEWESIAATLGLKLIDVFAGIAGAFVAAMTGAAVTVAKIIQSVLAPIREAIRRVAGTDAAKLAGQSGKLGELAGALDVDLEGRAGRRGEEAQDRIRAQAEGWKVALARFVNARRDARLQEDAEARAGWANWLQEGKDALKGLVEAEEYRAWEKSIYDMLQAELGAARGGGGGGGGGMAAPREARGMFTAGLVGASAAQALGAGTQPALRDLLGEARKTNDHLADIAGKVEPPVVGN